LDKARKAEARNYFLLTSGTELKQETAQYIAVSEFLFKQTEDCVVKLSDAETPCGRGKNCVIAGNGAQYPFGFAQRIKQARDQLCRARTGADNDDGVVMVNI
jgi:hypothetical protein